MGDGRSQLVIAVFGPLARRASLNAKPGRRGPRLYKCLGRERTWEARNPIAVKDVDAFLVEQFQSGDEAAFDVLVERHYRRVYEFAYYFAHSVDDAYDIAQEVFLRVFRSLHRFHGESSFYTWVYRIASNAAIDHHRRRRSYARMDIAESADQRPESEAFASNEPLPDANTMNEELAAQIRYAVQQLPEKQRQVFVLRHYEGLSLQEIADIVERELGTVKAHLFHATRKMRRLLAPYVDDALPVQETSNLERPRLRSS